MSSLLYIDSNGTQYTIPGIKIGSINGADGSTGTVQTVSNADYTAVIKTRISASERHITMTIPLAAATYENLIEESGEVLSVFRQTNTPSTLRAVYDDGSAREVEVYVQDGYPRRVFESNTFCWIELGFVACSPYWTDTEETEIIHNTAFENNGDYPAECKYTLNRTVNQITLDGDVIMKFRNGGMMLTHYITITDSAIAATDTSGNNALYKFTLDSQFNLIPTGTHTISGCKGTFRKRWGHA